MFIGICDDDKRWLQTSQKMLMEFANITHVDIEIRCFSTAEELLEYKDIPLDAVFLDIELGRTLGINVAKKLNETRPSCRIVYMTNYLQNKIILIVKILMMLKDCYILTMMVLIMLKKI